MGTCRNSPSFFFIEIGRRIGEFFEGIGDYLSKIRNHGRGATFATKFGLIVEILIKKEMGT